MLTLAEELLLIALDDEDGRVLSRKWGAVLVHSILERGLIGALLIELALRERLELLRGRLVVVDPSQTGVPSLDETLELLQRSEEQRSPQGWIQKLAKHHQGLEKRLLDGLVQRGILREEKGRFLFLFPTRRYPTEDHGPEQSVRARVSDFIEGRAPDPRTLLLVGLVSACDLVEMIAPDKEIKEVKAWIESFRGDSGVAESAVVTATTRQIEQDLSLMIAGMTAGVAYL